jgi:hypothetical protein
MSFKKEWQAFIFFIEKINKETCYEEDKIDQKKPAQLAKREQRRKCSYRID